MSKELKMRVGDEVARIVLLEDEAPETCKKVLASLPLKGNLIHAKIAGKEFFFKAPFFCDPENRVQAQEAGNIGYYDGANSICVFYGAEPGIGEVNLFARITENLEGIQKEGEKGWKRQGAEIEIYE
ncbi:MAG: DUF3830 family protein [Deltaproteobacteria bacterium]|nr:DUF3830 family protein [Deltaproteobacteria bacterium]MBW1961850.1 DUF3830 family protein [Deltaproteobacteria bacterium]MBW2153255.1 DUF3830 family protein [Deltaproteobacteria bacterium]